MMLPAQKVVLSSVENKKQLIQILFDELTQDRLFHLQSTKDHKFVVIEEDIIIVQQVLLCVGETRQIAVASDDTSCPLEVRSKERNTRYDLETHQEEADIIIVQQVLLCVGETRQIAVASDDTDVFLLLLYH